MGRYRAGLERRQMILSRLVDIGTELFAMSSSCAHALALTKKKPADGTPFELAELYCQMARGRIKRLFHDIRSNNDRFSNRVAGDMLDGKMTWLEEGIIPPGIETKKEESPLRNAHVATA